MGFKQGVCCTTIILGALIIKNTANDTNGAHRDTPHVLVITSTVFNFLDLRG